MNFGNAVKLVRTQKDMSQVDLAKASDLSVSYLSLLERNKRDPNFSVVERIGRALNVPLTILMFLAADKNEITDISPDLAGALAAVTLKVIKATVQEQKS